MDLKYIGENIKKRRKELGLTQVQIKELVGISSGNISELENGNRSPSCQALLLLSKVLECSVDWLLCNHSSKSEILENFITVSSLESSLLNSFRVLDNFEKNEVLEYVQFKEFKASHTQKRDLIGTGKSYQSDPDCNSSNNCGIA